MSGICQGRQQQFGKALIQATVREGTRDTKGPGGTHQSSSIAPAAVRLAPCVPADSLRTAGAEGRKDALMMATCAWPGQQTNKRANEQPESGAYWQAERERMTLGGYLCGQCVPMGTAATRVNHSTRGPSRRAN